MKRQKTGKSPKKNPKSQQKSPKDPRKKNPKKSLNQPPKDQNKKQGGTISPSGDAGKSSLQKLKTEIERDKKLDDKLEQIETVKEDKILETPPPSAPSDDSPKWFEPSEIMLEVTAQLTFHTMKNITRIFDKDLNPLTDQQRAQLERLIARLAEKYVPQALSKYQEFGDIALVLGGIMITNITEKGVIKSVQPQQPQTLPEKVDFTVEIPKNEPKNTEKTQETT